MLSRLERLQVLSFRVGFGWDKPTLLVYPLKKDRIWDIPICHIPHQLRIGFGISMSHPTSLGLFKIILLFLKILFKIR